MLHITNWYPNPANKQEALWIQRHIQSLSPHIESYFVLHLEVRPSNRLCFIHDKIPHGIQRRFEIPVESWFLIEVMTALLLAYYLLKMRRRQFDIANFHIAYPLMVYWHHLKKLVRIPVVITEHWSAYHFNFGLSPARRLPRVQRIFCQDVPVIAVSDALAKDIAMFSKCDCPVRILPNVVDNTTFYADASIKRGNFFFMLSQWKWPKRPLVVLEAFQQFAKGHAGFVLKIAGYGPDYQKLARWIEVNEMQHAVVLMGQLQPSEIAWCFQTCRAFLHPTEYETFSVVCAEAVSCGTPVLASAVGGIREVVRDEEGILLDRLDISTWEEGMRNILNKKLSPVPSDRFSPDQVGRAYYKILSQIAARMD